MRGLYLYLNAALTAALSKIPWGIDWITSGSLTDPTSVTTYLSTTHTSIPLSAALLVERGWNVEGLTLWLMKGQGSCCSEGLVDAAGLCEDLGIHHEIIDSRAIFEREVIKKTTEGYEKGFTPLPCSMCNKNVKFEEMLNYATNKKEFTHFDDESINDPRPLNTVILFLSIRKSIPFTV